MYTGLIEILGPGGKCALMSEENKGRSLSPLEAFFLSFGGQSPWISLIAFGTVALKLGGSFISAAMLIATALVMLNGLVVSSLASRFGKSGGYYVYALYSLSENMGFQTGWNYLLYSVAYGATLLAGGVYVITQIAKIQPIVSTLLLLVVASSLALAGIRESAKYAMGVGVLEITAIVGISILMLFRSHFPIVDPLSQVPRNPAAPILFALGIPTGYGSLTSYAGEIKDSKRNVGKITVAVILTGGLISTLFFYALTPFSPPSLVEFLGSDLIPYFWVFVLLLSVVDGILGGLAYMLATSRVLYIMSKDGHFHPFLAKVFQGRPLAAEVLSVVAFWAVLLLGIRHLGVYLTFSSLAAVAGLTNLFIHFSSNFSLVRLASKRLRKRALELMLAISALSLSGWVFIYSLSSVSKFTSDLVFGYIILGFLYAEVMEILGRSKGETRD